MHCHLNIINGQYSVLLKISYPRRNLYQSVTLLCIRVLVSVLCVSVIKVEYAISSFLAQPVDEQCRCSIACRFCVREDDFTPAKKRPKKPLPAYNLQNVFLVYVENIIQKVLLTYMTAWAFGLSSVWVTRFGDT